MTGRCFFDSNILIYAFDKSDPQKQKIAFELLSQAIFEDQLYLSPQSFNECYRVLAHRLKYDPKVVRDFIEELSPFCRAVMTVETVNLAWTIEDQTQFQWYDCLLLASAIQANCKVFYSEDMQHSRDIAGMRLVNPFVA